MNNPPLAFCDIPENTFWYNINNQNATRLFKLTKKWYHPANKQRTVELEEQGDTLKTTEITSEEFISQTQKGKLIYIPDLDKFNKQQNP